MWITCAEVACTIFEARDDRSALRWIVVNAVLDTICMKHRGERRIIGAQRQPSVQFAMRTGTSPPREGKSGAAKRRARRQGRTLYSLIRKNPAARL
jgi:hypothetical protein